MQKYLLIFNLVLFGINLSLCKAANQLPTGELRPTTVGDLKPHPLGNNSYNEFWSYSFTLDNDMQVNLNYTRANVGSFKPPLCGSDLTVLNFKGRNYFVAREYKKENFTFEDSSQKLSVHEKIWFKGKLPESHEVYFSTTKKNTSYYLNLQFTEIKPGQVWGDGLFRLGGKEKIGIFIHIPFAKVQGFLAINNDTLKVQGTAYMDHTYQSNFAPELVNSGFRYVSHTGSYEAGYYLQADGDYGHQILGYGLQEKGGVFSLLKPSSMQILNQSKALGVKVPTQLQFQFDNGSKTLLERSQDKLQRSTLDEFSGFTKMAVKSYMGGEVFNFVGNGKLNTNQTMNYYFFTID